MIIVYFKDRFMRIAIARFYEKGHVEFTAYRKYIGKLFTGSKQLKKKSKFHLSFDNIKEIHDNDTQVIGWKLQKC